MNIFSWNVNGLRAVHRKELLLPFIQQQNPDILCLQETKSHPEQLPEEILNIENYHSYFASAEKKGYSGTAIYTKEKPEEVTTTFESDVLNHEGRIIEAHYKNFILLNVYFPNGGAGNKRVEFKIDFYSKFLNRIDNLKKQGKNIIFTGDVNTAHQEIDLARPKENQKNTGFLPEERAWIDEVIEHGYIDTFRMFNKDPDQYTYWDMKTRARDRNVGWRIDYFFVNEEVREKIKSATILPEVLGSDHCPIALEIEI